MSEHWSPDGQSLAVMSYGIKVQGAVISLDGGQTPVVFDEDDEIDEPHFSPDGKGIAYDAQPSGSGWEVNVVPNPPTRERVQHSQLHVVVNCFEELKRLVHNDY